MSRAVVHIGLHKTGSTSFQMWADTNREALQAASGLRYYRGRHGSNHLELANVVMRLDRNMPYRAKHADWNLPSFQSELRSHIAEQLAGDDDVLISSEALGLLRHEEEVEGLIELLAPRSVEFVVVLREPSAYLASYRREIARKGHGRSTHPESFAYTEDDSWLVDYDRRLEVFPEPAVLHYEALVAEWGSVIPAIMEAVGVDPGSLPDWRGVWANDRPGLARKIGRRLRHPLART
jgi:hypothetical protein